MENGSVTNNENEHFKSNKSFAEELRKCRMILDIYFTDNIEEKILVEKKEIESLKNNYEEYKKIQKKLGSENK